MHPDCPFTEKDVARFSKRVAIQPNGCHLWMGARMPYGYGMIGVGGENWRTHRFAWTVENGPIPFGAIIRHKCDNPPCVNPEHLEVGTYKDNTQDMLRRGRANFAYGENAGAAVLSESEVKKIKKAIIAGTETLSELARIYKVGKSTIGAIRSALSWNKIGPAVPKIIPQPHRKMSDQDYLDIRDAWRAGSALKELAAKYETRVDNIQAIIKGKRGTNVPVGERVIRQNKTKLTADQRKELFCRYKQGESQISLAHIYGMSKNGVYLLLKHMQA